jgi:RNA polymerase sigma-70 factor (ECF subfamily)
MKSSSDSNPGEPAAPGLGGDSRLRAGPLSAQEFSAQYRACARVMWLIAVGILGDAHEADDVVQEAALIAYRKRESFASGTSFRSWVGTIVRNVAMNALRSSRRRRGLVEGWTGAQPAGDAPLSAASSNGAVLTDRVIDARVLRALSDMGDVARACLLLRTVGELQYAEIASMLAIPEGTAMSHVHRARAHLRERLSPVWNERIGGTAGEPT